MQPGSTTSTPRHDSAAVRDNLAEIRSKLSFQLNSGGGGTSSYGGDNNNNNTSFNQNGSFSRFRQRPLFTFGNAAGAHRDPTHQTMGGGTPQRGVSSERPQTPVGRSPSTQASAQYLLSTQRELERVQRDKHEWERRCMELESTNAELTNELEYLSGCMSQQQQQAANDGSFPDHNNDRDDVGPGIDLRASNTSSTPPAQQQQHQPPVAACPGLSLEEAAKLHAKIASLTASLDEVSAERDSLLGQHQATGHQLEVLMNEYEKEKAAKDLSISALEKELEKVNQSCGKALRAAEQMQARHENEIAELEAELLEAREELDNVSTAAATVNTDSTNAMTDALHHEVAVLTQKLKASEGNASSLEEELADVRSQLVSSERLQLELEEDQRTLEEEVSVAKKLIEELTTKNINLNDTYTSLVDTQPLCEQLEAELKHLQNQLDAQIASSNAREKQLEAVMADQEGAFKEQVEALESQRALDQQAIADLQEQLESVSADAADAVEKLQHQEIAAAANIEEEADAITSKQLAENESSAIAWLTGQLAEMTETMEGVCPTSTSNTDGGNIIGNHHDDEDIMNVALEAAEKAQQQLQYSSHDSQTELQNAIQDCARALQERQHTHLSMHKENLQTRELKKKEWMNRKLEDVEAAYVAKIDGLESMLEELQEQLVAHDAGDDDELASVKEECKQHKAACEVLETLMKEQEAQLEQLIAKDAATIQESNANTVAEYEEEIALLRTSLDERTAAYEDIKKAQTILEQHIDEEEQDRAANSSTRDAALMSRLAGLTEEYEAVVAEYDAVVAERDAFVAEVEDLKESLAEKEETLEEADKQLQQQREEIANARQSAAIVSSSSTPSPSSPSTTWPTTSSVLGVEIDHKLPTDTLEALIAECGHFGDLTFSKPHVYDHTCWAFDAFHLDNPESEAGYGPHLLLHICCSIYRDIVDPDWSLEDGSVAEMDAKATSMGLPPMNTFLSFVATVYNGYHHRSSVPYHNRTHAADIVQMSVLLVRNALLPKNVAASATGINNNDDDDSDITPVYLWDVLTPLDRFALLIAALTHDYNHPGKKNVFLSRMRDPVAVRYSGKSVLENHHATATFSICQDATTDITEHMSDQQRDTFHTQVTTMILNTDMTLHVKHLEEFAQKAVYPLFTSKNGECSFNEVTSSKDRLDAMCTLLHAADVGNSARPFHIARKWGVAVRDEFFAQGAVEKLLGYDISFGCNEEADTKSGGIGPDQLSFIDNMILPFWHVLVKRYGVETPGYEDLREEYNSLLDGIMGAQRAILDEALEVSTDPIRGEDVSIPLTFDMENAETFAWRGAYGLQMMVDALQSNRLMWLEMSAPEHQSRFPIDAPADKAALKIVALNNATEEEKAIEDSVSNTAIPKKLTSDNDDAESCSECEMKQNALVEMQKALAVGQQDVEELLANKAVLLKELTQAQEDLEAAASAAPPPPSSDARPALEEQHQARVKQLKEMIMTANQKKNELEVENKELKRRVMELEASTMSVNNTSSATVSSPNATTTTTPVSAATSRPVSRYGVQGSMGGGGDSSSSEEEDSVTARRQSF